MTYKNALYLVRRFYQHAPIKEFRETAESVRQLIKENHFTVYQYHLVEIKGRSTVILDVI